MRYVTRTSVDPPDERVAGLAGTGSIESDGLCRLKHALIVSCATDLTGRILEQPRCEWLVEGARVAQLVSICPTICSC